jgi:UDP-glucose 4-epimerase
MVLPRFVAAALRGEDLIVHGDGRQSRCFCDVRDTAGVLPRLLAAEQCRGQVYNVGSDRAVTIRELADTVVRVTESASRVRLVPYAEVYGEGFEDLRQRRPDLRKVRAAVGFEPKVALDRTIRDVARWMALTRRAEPAP